MEGARAILEAVLADLPPPPPAQVQTSTNFAPDFVAFVKNLEQAQRLAVHKPHKSPEGGAATIGYGHKIKPGEKFTALTDAQATKLLTHDLEQARQKVYDHIKRVYDLQLRLSRKQEEMLTEFAFNLGSLRAFPKFVDAVLREDWAKAKQEYRRSYLTPEGKRLQLDRRNQLFAQRYGL